MRNSFQSWIYVNHYSVSTLVSQPRHPVNSFPAACTPETKFHPPVRTLVDETFPLGQQAARKFQRIFSSRRVPLRVERSEGDFNATVR
jgi:hypothetical protein